LPWYASPPVFQGWRVREPWNPDDCAMNELPVIDYAHTTKRSRLRAAVFWTLAGLSLLVCLFACWTWIESATLAVSLKQSGFDPWTVAQFEITSHRNGRNAILVCAVIGTMWGVHFYVRGRRAKPDAESR
jgi:hypothetical protein